MKRIRLKRPRLRLDPEPYERCGNRYCGAMAGDAKAVAPGEISRFTTRNCAASRAMMTI